jgi:hypothetical protein
MSFNYRSEARLYESACKDKTPGRYFQDLSEAIDTGAIKPTEISIRKLFQHFVKDGFELVESFNPQADGGYRVQEALDAVDTSAFANINGQLIYKTMLDAFNVEANVFSNLVTTVQTSFNGERIPGLGGIGEKSEVVDEGKPYPMVGLNEDWIDTPQTKKRGLIVPVTKEAIFFDRTGMILEMAGQVGEYLGINKENRIIDAIIDENTTAHRFKWRGTTYATYQTSTPWINSKTSNGLVDFTNVDAAEQMFANLVDLNTGEPIEVEPKHLICTRDLKLAAARAVAPEVATAVGGYATSGNLNSTKFRNTINDYMIISSKRLKARLATDTDWFIGDVTKAVKYMQNFPLTVQQSGADSEDGFNRDIVVKYKASERGAAAVVKPQALLKNAA